MKLFIINGENNGEKLKIIINESLFVTDIKKKLDEILNGNGNFSKYYFVLIHKNIILLDDNSIKHYKICENDEIWFGKVENYLRNDDVIVHVVIVKGLVPSDEHLIVKMNDTISIVKSIIERVHSEIIIIWNMKGEQMKNDQIITEIDSNEYLKLIIIYDDENGNKIFNTFDEWCRFHDKYWVDGYLYIDGVRDNNQNESTRTILISRMKKIKQIISSNNTIDDRLNQNLSDLPNSFINSMVLFSIDMINRIVDICDDYWKFVMNQYENDVVRIFKQYHYDAIRAALLDFSNIRKCNNKTKKLVSDVIIDALDYFINYLNDPSNDWQYWLGIWMNQYLLRSFSDSDLNEAINESNIYTIQTRMNGEDRKNFIQFKPETIFKAKQLISALFKVDIKYLHCIKPGGDNKPNDEDKFDDEFVIEILFNMDDIKKLRSIGKGTFAKIILYLDKISNKQFVLKKSIQNDGDLYRNINIYSKLSSSRSIMNYSRLFRNKENICIGMEYMSGGSLKCYLSKGKHLTEQEIVKISFEILTQINELHKLGIIHRDIKPDNIVLDEHNHAKLIDFGLSKDTTGLKSEDLLHKLKAYIPGTIYYMAPELIKGEAYSEKIDIWSFGMVIIEMVTAKIPFHWLKEYQLIMKIPLCTKYEFEPILPISNELKKFIHLCLNTNPDERPGAEFLIKSTLFISYL